MEEACGTAVLSKEGPLLEGSLSRPELQGLETDGRTSPQRQHLVAEEEAIKEMSIM